MCTLWCSKEGNTVQELRRGVLVEALGRFRQVGTRDFFVPCQAMAGILNHILAGTTSPRMSLNRPQVGGGRLVHWVVWRGLRFICVSRSPLSVGWAPIGRDTPGAGCGAQVGEGEHETC